MLLLLWREEGSWLLLLRRWRTSKLLLLLLGDKLLLLLWGKLLGRSSLLLTLSPGRGPGCQDSLELGLGDFDLERLLLLPLLRLLLALRLELLLRNELLLLTRVEGLLLLLLREELLPLALLVQDLPLCELLKGEAIQTFLFGIGDGILKSRNFYIAFIYSIKYPYLDKFKLLLLPSQESLLLEIQLECWKCLLRRGLLLLLLGLGARLLKLLLGLELLLGLRLELLWLLLEILLLLLAELRRRRLELGLLLARLLLKLGPLLLLRLLVLQGDKLLLGDVGRVYGLALLEGPKLLLRQDLLLLGLWLRLRRPQFPLLLNLLLTLDLGLELGDLLLLM